MFLFTVRAAAADRYTPPQGRTTPAAEPPTQARGCDGRQAARPVGAVRTDRGGDRGLADQPGRPSSPRECRAAVDGRTPVRRVDAIKWPVVDTVDPRPFDPC